MNMKMLILAGFAGAVMALAAPSASFALDAGPPAADIEPGTPSVETEPAAPAPAPSAEPDNFGSAISTGKQAVDAFRRGGWLLGAALVVMLAVFAVKRFAIKSIPGSALPYVSLGLGVLGGVADVVIAANGQPIDWLSAVLAGLMAGGAAVGGWETFGKRILGRVSDRDAVAGRG